MYVWDALQCLHVAYINVSERIITPVIIVIRLILLTIFHLLPYHSLLLRCALLLLHHLYQSLKKKCL